jgi:hypothetical protein
LSFFCLPQLVRWKNRHFVSGEVEALFNTAHPIVDPAALATEALQSLLSSSSPAPRKSEPRSRPASAR